MTLAVSTAVMHTPLCSDDVRYTIPAVPIKQACHVATSAASTAQYAAGERSHRASSSFHPPAAASPATASAVAAACMITCTSTAMRNPPDTALRYTSSITGRYAAKSPAAPSVTAKPTKYLARLPPPGCSPESDDRSAISTELSVRSTTALRLEKLSGWRTMMAASTSVKASCVDSSSDEVDTGRYDELYEKSRLFTPMSTPMTTHAASSRRVNHANGRGCDGDRPA
ncbi:unknown protein [Oryza sativa Japonica Group]|uniref:Os01g0680100 protein n=2 Tax=Oryza sativa subsp. japonica TaxID=39947 RepID=Q5QLF1_ORYSJ|nr:unknown protein [Oryza sativa Japonica Group]BAD73744.1 unknown protein [Oryza sativa Japonica Group]BAF05785.1 Os01g0680100 [Oryza sativa Japonica Group]BAS73695.1 Os01g0680100 [Oryza sativa Japonica Group]|eukprot:NP_001043871.1 Os01g0680100 [Oryza sativa Japonica Group]